MTPETWFALVVLLQQQPARCIAKEDRVFLAQMLNQLAVDAPPEPKAWEQRWLMALKRECRLFKK
jgi:hypothetical protein